MSVSMDQITALCKRRGFIYPGSEIYGGFGNSYTYGPYGSQIKKNIKDLWWKNFIESRFDMVGIDGDIILHPKTWHASGHVGGFNDQMVDCKNCRARLRADHLVESALDMDCEGMPDEAITQLIRENQLKCPKCGGTDFTEVRKFNLMFSTQMAKTAEKKSTEDDIDLSTAFLRPETAQAIFLEFKNVTDSMRVKVPFGIGQIGKAFRNEITPGNFIFRRLEFEQMEIEYFITPPEHFEENRAELLKIRHLNDWPVEMKNYINAYFDQWQRAMFDWCDLIGISQNLCHIKEHTPEKLSHYSKRTFDIEFDFPFGQKELYGCAYRTDFDLSQHEKFSGKKLKYRDPISNKEYIPHVIEPTFGVDRSILAVLVSAYAEEMLEDGSVRTVMRFTPNVAPVKTAVLPLMKKDGLPEIAQEIFSKIKKFGNTEYDDSGAIGKRYRRQDEIGTPVCITVDYETKEDNAVTVRDRDTMQQERIKIQNLENYLEKVL